MKSTSRLLFGGGLLLASLIALFVLIFVASVSNASPEQPAQVITITAKDMRFDLDSMTAKVGQPITIQFVNDDMMDHAFAIDALDFYTDQIGPHETVSVTFTPQAVGTYQFRCPFPGHDQLGMVGTFEVVP